MRAVLTELAQEAKSTLGDEALAEIWPDVLDTVGAGCSTRTRKRFRRFRVRRRHAREPSVPSPTESEVRSARFCSSGPSPGDQLGELQTTQTRHRAPRSSPHRAARAAGTAPEAADRSRPDTCSCRHTIFAASGSRSSVRRHDQPRWLAEEGGSRTHQTRGTRLTGFEVRAPHRGAILFLSRACRPPRRRHPRRAGGPGGGRRGVR